MGVRPLWMGHLPALVCASLLAMGCVVAGDGSGDGTVTSALQNHPRPLALSTSTVAAGWYTTAQARQGGGLYASNCAKCHGASLQGGAGPALAGSAFVAQWSNRTLSDLYGFVHSNMPLTAPGSLTAQQYADITAYVLQRNGFVAGATQLRAGSEISRLLRPSGSARDLQRNVHSMPPLPAVTGPLAAAPVRAPSTTGPTDAEIEAADTATTSWLTYNHGLRGYRFSTLRDITPTTASQLRPVCIYQTGDGGTFEGGLVAYGALLYGTTTNGTFAIDAETCEEVWKHTYTPGGATYNNTNRGLAIARGRVIRGTIDGHVLALDAQTGALLWDRDVTGGKPGQFIAAAPLIWHDIVLIGRAGGDLATHGALLALQAADGSSIWTFETIPTGDATGAGSWQRAGTPQYGGGAVWTAFSLDPATGTVIFPVGNPAPDFNASVRPGSNLFTGSVVAVDARTGALRWHNQLYPSDYHDWDMSVVALIDGSDGKPYVATAGKGGTLFLLDRTTGATVWRRPVTTILNDTLPITAAGLHYCPGSVGGVEWNGPGYDPTRDLLFINATDWCIVGILGPVPTPQPGLSYTGLANSYGAFDPVSEAHGWVNAVEASTGGMRWRAPMRSPMIAAVTPTAGGVIFTGDVTGNFLVLAADDGRVVYRFNTGGSMGGGVITYRRNTRQFVAITSGNSSRTWYSGGSPTVIIFSR